MATTRPRGRPEETADASTYYNKSEAKKYAMNSRMITIQREMAERCLHLLELPEGKRCLLLDLGCGSGLSGEAITDKNHIWLGCDISESMLDVAKARSSEGDLFHSDLGQGLYFRDGVFDGAISVSTLQWLCGCSEKVQNPWRRLHRFFESLFRCLKRGSRACFQIYPKNTEQLEMIAEQAKRAGFHTGLMIDNPESTKAKKYYLLCDSGTMIQNPDNKSDSIQTKNMMSFTKDNFVGKRKNRKGKLTGKAWIKKKKQQRKLKGLKTAKDSKYTGRRRGPKF